MRFAHPELLWAAPAAVLLILALAWIGRRRRNTARTLLTGGRYYPLGDRGEGFGRLRDECLKPLTESAAREDLKNYTEGFQVPLGLAVLALVLRFAIGARRVRRAWKPSSIRSPHPTSP